MVLLIPESSSSFIEDRSLAIEIEWEVAKCYASRWQKHWKARTVPICKGADSTLHCMVAYGRVWGCQASNITVHYDLINHAALDYSGATWSNPYRLPSGFFSSACSLNQSQQSLQFKGPLGRSMPHSLTPHGALKPCNTVKQPVFIAQRTPVSNW